MNIKLKKVFSLVIVFCLCFSVVACKKRGTTDQDSTKDKVVQGETSGQKDDSSKKDNDADSTNQKNNDYTLYFSDSNAEYLVGEMRKIENATPKVVIEELIKGPKTETLMPSLNKDIHINDVTVKDKIATVDFDESVLGKIAGTTGEQMAMYGMANTLILNKDLGIEKVQFTLKGEPMESLGGHILLEKPTEANETLIKK